MKRKECTQTTQAYYKFSSCNKVLSLLDKIIANNEGKRAQKAKFCLSGYQKAKINVPVGFKELAFEEKAKSQTPRLKRKNKRERTTDDTTHEHCEACWVKHRQPKML